MPRSNPPLLILLVRLSWSIWPSFPVHSNLHILKEHMICPKFMQVKTAQLLPHAWTGNHLSVTHDASDMDTNKYDRTYVKATNNLSPSRRWLTNPSFDRSNACSAMTNRPVCLLHNYTSFVIHPQTDTLSGLMIPSGILPIGGVMA